jgi:hypothetical protein
MFGRLWALLAAALVLAGCNPLARDPGVDAEVRSVFDQLRRHQTAELTARLNPSLRTPATAAQIAAVEGFLPKGEPRGRKAIGTNAVTFAGKGQQVSITDEYDYGDRRALVDTTISRAAGQTAWVVEGFNVRVATNAELARNRLLQPGKSAMQYLFFAMVIVSPLVMIAALVKVIRTPGLKRKWLWGIAAFLGLVPFHMDWTTGRFDYELVAVQLVGAGAVKGLSAFSPWVLSFCIPVGAILILTGVWANPARARKPKVAAEPVGPG